MNWKLKSLIQRVCGSIPGGRSLYFQLQKRGGGLRQPKYFDKFSCHHSLMALLQKNEFKIQGAEVMEVGTGWIPLAPIGFWLCGAARVRTYDLNRYMRLPLVRNALHWICDNEEKLVALYSDVASPQIVRSKIALLNSMKEQPEEFLRYAGIQYCAPADASNTGLPDQSVDLHFSSNVFEHVPREILHKILIEGRRLLRPAGVALHHVDPTDHFSHCDPSITTINFLRFKQHEWAPHSESQFSYHNRLRDLDYRRVFGESGFQLRECRSMIDERALKAIREGFPLSDEFRDQDPEALCRCSLDYVAFTVSGSTSRNLAPTPVLTGTKTNAAKPVG